jgi:hypothetical protein
MRMLRNEKILYQSENKRFTLTNFRLREEKETSFGKYIKSMMLEEMTASEMRTIKKNKVLKWAISIFLCINGLVYIYNHFFITAEISKFFFESNKIPANAALTIFYISSIIALALIWLFFLSIKRVASFYAPGVEIDAYLKWFDDDVREIMIGKVEQSKTDRINFLNGRIEKNEID